MAPSVIYVRTYVHVDVRVSLLHDVHAFLLNFTDRCLLATFYKIRATPMHYGTLNEHHHFCTFLVTVVDSCDINHAVHHSLLLAMGSTSHIVNMAILNLLAGGQNGQQLNGLVTG